MLKGLGLVRQGGPIRLWIWISRVRIPSPTLTPAGDWPQRNGKRQLASPPRVYDSISETLGPSHHRRTSPALLLVCSVFGQETRLRTHLPNTEHSPAGRKVSAVSPRPEERSPQRRQSAPRRCAGVFGIRSRPVRERIPRTPNTEHRKPERSD